MNKISNIKEKSKSYLSFKIENEIFAAHVAHVKNIIEVPQITKLPNTQEYIIGVINLRGTVLPVIDTNLRFNNKKTEFTSLTSIVILELNYEGKIIVAGALVDSVNEVLEIDEDQILHPPKVKGLQKANVLILGVVEYKEKFILLLDMNKLLDEEIVAKIDKQLSKIENEVTH